MRYKIAFLFILFMFSLHINSMEINVLITDNKPLTYFDEDTGHYSGFFIDILEYIAKEEDWTINYRICSLNECIKLIQDPHYDMIADIGYSDERSKYMLFNSESVYITWAEIYSRKNIALTSLKELHNTTISVEEDDFFLMDKQHGFQTLVEQMQINIKYSKKKNYKAVFEENASGKTDYSLVNRTFGEMYADEYELHPTGLIFSPVSLRFAFNKSNINNYRYAAIIDKYLLHLKSDKHSAYYTLMTKYLLPEVRKNYIPLWIIIIIGALIYVIVMILFVYRHKIILERKYSLQLNTDLFKQKQIHSVLLDIIPSGIIMTNPEGTIIYANNTAAEALHSDRKNILNRPYNDNRLQIKGFDGKQINEDELPFNIIMRTGKCLKEYRHTTIDEKTKKTQFLIISGCPVFDKDNIIAIVFSIDNITKYISLNKNLLKSQKFEFISQISSGIIHDMRHLCLEMEKQAKVLKEFKDNKTKTAGENLLSSIELSNDLIEQITMLSNRDQDRPLVFDINASLGKFISIVKAIIPKRIKLVFREYSDPLLVYADINRINQMVLSLIMNARDSITDKGTITVEIEQKEDGENRFCSLSVEDNGKGMEKSIQKAIFRPFYSTKGSHGTGLGLHIVNTIVQSYNGRISVESFPGEGTVFRVLIPIAKP